MIFRMMVAFKLSYNFEQRRVVDSAGSSQLTAVQKFTINQKEEIR